MINFMRRDFRHTQARSNQTRAKRPKMRSPETAAFVERQRPAGHLVQGIARRATRAVAVSRVFEEGLGRETDARATVGRTICSTALREFCEQASDGKMLESRACVATEEEFAHAEALS